MKLKLNLNFPSGVTIIWTYNSNTFNLGPYDAITQDGSTATLIIGNPQSSDAGFYGCSFRFDPGPVVRLIQLG